MWRSRFQILFKFSNPTSIENTHIDYDRPWIDAHTTTLSQAYGQAPYFNEYAYDFFSILEEKHKTISLLNEAIIRWVCKTLDIKTQIVRSSSFSVSGKKTDRLIEILTLLKASKYISGPSAKNYLEENKFKKHGIELIYKKYNYENYPQLHGEFAGAISILDLLFMCGPDSRNWL